MGGRNVETIREMYAAFGRGDVEAIMARVADDTDWSFNVGPSSVPHHARVHGKGELPRFFTDFGTNVQLEAFEVGDFIAAGHDVIAPIHIRYLVNRTGKRVEMDQLHWWRFNDDGKVVSLRHFEDTAAVQSAFAA